jgi:hypothetical protein
VVLYFDEYGRPHKALVTAVWGDGHGMRLVPDGMNEDGSFKSKLEYVEGQEHWPSLNLTYVSDDESKVDQYGRQIERGSTSVVHQSNQAAHGRYWQFLD